MTKFVQVFVVSVCFLGITLSSSTGSNDELCNNPKMKQLLEDYHDDIVKSINNCKYIFDGIIEEVETLNGTHPKLHEKAQELSDFNKNFNSILTSDHDHCVEVEIFEKLLNILSSFLISMKNATSDDLTYKLLLEKYITQRMESNFVDKFTGYWIYYDKAVENLMPFLTDQERNELEIMKKWFENLNMMKKLAAFKYFYNICDNV